MSETDSENDYESADEAEVAIAKSESKITDVSSLDPPPALADPPVAEPHLEKKADDEKKDKIPSSDVDDKAALKDVVDSNLTSLSKEIQSVSINNSETAKKNDSVIDTQPKRVTLRLEKKIQERNQAANVADEKEEENQPQTGIEEKPSSWGFSSWGSSLLSTAASSVSTFTSQVSQGIGTVLETVETSLGAPPPEDLASILKERRDAGDNSSPLEEEADSSEDQKTKVSENKIEEVSSTSSSLFSGVTSLTKVIESTGSKVLMGGLDTLELIGKKTFDILTEGDPGLRNKRSVFSNTVNLSQLLREAKDKAEKDQANISETGEEETVYFSTFFDEFQGLVHLEALEMLSSQCQNKVQGALMMMNADSSVKDDLGQLKKICEDLPTPDETPDEKTQDFEESIAKSLKYLQIETDLKKLIKVRNSIHTWFDECTAEQEKSQVKNAKELHDEAIRSLAEYTATCVEHFHKFGELILVQNDPDFSSLLCATHLTELTSVLSVEVSIIASKFGQCLSTAADDSEDPDSITPLITTVFLEASNSTTYIQDAFQLLIPVLQATILE